MQQQAPTKAQQAVDLWDHIFLPDDVVLVRPIETWEENGQKKSRGIYKAVIHWPKKMLCPEQFDLLLKPFEKDHPNLFFGTCPRFGAKGFDLAWQIRVVRCLWVDVDDCDSTEDFLARIESAGLPHPSAIVRSGHGFHGYWKLAEAYRIDDVGDPPQVQTEWVDIDDKRKAIDYFEQGGEKVYLKDPKTGKSIRANVPDLSPKAVHVQDIIAGIAAAIGGDSTQDLSRLLRVPGSMNLKNARNGQTPVPCELVELSGEAFPLSAFEHFAKQSPSAQRREKVNRVKLRKERPISAKRQDILDQKILACDVAEIGDRSDADFALCCWAVEYGVPREELWSQVCDIGKFGERGREYFDRTMAKAEGHAREKAFTKAEQKPSNRGESRHDHQKAQGDHSETIIDIFPDTPYSFIANAITGRLLDTGKAYRRQDSVVMVSGDEYHTIHAPAELAGTLSQTTEFRFNRGEESYFDPLPQKYANPWFHNKAETGRFPEITLFTRNPVFTNDWRLTAPGHDQQTGIYYAGPAIQPTDGTKCLDALFRDFCFKEASDRTNYVGMLLTAVLINRFTGSKPGVIFNGTQPELGKTILAQIISIVRDGRRAETCSYTDDDTEFEKRLAARVRSGATTIIIDNAKGSRGRKCVVDSGCLERSITDAVLSFRLLTRSEEIRAENSHIFCITVNAAEVSRDIITRCIPVNLYFEGDPTDRVFSIQDPEEYAVENRPTLLAELLGMVERWRASGMPLSDAKSRFNKKGWAKIIGGILDANGEPDFLANVDSAAKDFDPVRREFGELVEIIANVKEPPSSYGWTSGDFVAIAEQNGLFKRDLEDRSPRSKNMVMGHLATRFVGQKFDVGLTGALNSQSPESPGQVSLRKRPQGRNPYYIVQFEGAYTE